MSANLLALWYLAASVLFILALKGLSSPVSARRGNLFGMIGMAIAVLVTLAITKNLAPMLVAVAVVNNPSAFNVPDPVPRGNRLELFIGSFVGAVTFSGSVIAFGKLAGLGKMFRLFSSAPVIYKGQHLLNLILAIVMIGFGIAF